MRMPSEKAMTLVAPRELNQTTGVLIVDVRRPDEFNGELGHIPHAKLAPLGRDLTSFLAKIPRDRKIVFVCRSGARSATATEEAMRLGFTQTANMVGGMLLWNAEKLPLEETDFTKENKMKLNKNIHSVERVFRIFVGLGLSSLAFFGPANPWFLLGLIPVVTGVVGWCPPYALLGINTCRGKKSGGFCDGNDI